MAVGHVEQHTSTVTYPDTHAPHTHTHSPHIHTPTHLFLLPLLTHTPPALTYTHIFVRPDIHAHRHINIHARTYTPDAHTHVHILRAITGKRTSVRKKTNRPNSKRNW